MVSVESGAEGLISCVVVVVGEGEGAALTVATTKMKAARRRGRGRGRGVMGICIFLSLLIQGGGGVVFDGVWRRVCIEDVRYDEQPAARERENDNSEFYSNNLARDRKKER